MPGSMYTGQDIIINGVVFNRVDEEGNKWIITDLEGWWGLPDATVPDDPRPFQEDGGYSTIGRYESRQIVVSGYVIPGPGDGSVPNTLQNKSIRAARARDSLNRAMNLVRSTAIMQVNESSQPKIAAVQLVARPLTTFNDIRNVLEFNFQLRASDPRKYALDPTLTSTALQSMAEGRTYPKTYNYNYGLPGSDGLMTVTNDGSYNTYGVITINGPVTQPKIEHIELGRSLSFDLSLGETEFLEINLKDKTVLINGTESRRNKLTPGSSWFWFSPGDSSLRFTGYQVVRPSPGYPAAENLATNPSFETAYGTSGSRINATQNPRAISTISAVNDPPTGWTYAGGTGETGVLVGAGRDTSPDGVEVRRNYMRNPQAVGSVTGAVDGYGGSIANFGTWAQGTGGLTALLVPGTTFNTRTNYARDPRASQGYTSSGTGWTYTAGTSETGVGISASQTAVTRTNLYENPKFAAPETDSSAFFDGYNDTDVFLGTCFTIVRTSGLGSNSIGAGLKNFSYSTNTTYTVSFKVRAVGQDLTSGTVIPVYLRPVGPAVTTGQVLLGDIVQAAGDPQTYVFSATSSGTAAVDPSIALSIPAAWGTTDDAVMITDVLVESASTDGSFFYGGSAEVNLSLDRHVAYGWTGTENASTSQAVESLQQNAPGPDGVPGFVRRYVTVPKSTGTSGWVYYDTDATLSAANGDKGIASMYVRSTSAITVRLQLERRTSGGVLVGTAESGSNVTLVPNTWTRINVPDTADGTAAQFAVRMDIITDGVSTALPRGTIIDATALLMERGTTLRDYFDGDTPAEVLPFDRTISYSWVSTPGDSASNVGEIIAENADLGPIDDTSSFARAVIVERKTGGTSGWEGRSASVVSPVTVTAGQRYTTSLYVRYVGTDADLPVKLRIEYQSVAGTALQTLDSDEVSLPTGEWVRLLVSSVAETNASYIGWSIRDTSTLGAPADSVVDVTGVLIEKELTAGTTLLRTNLHQDPYAQGSYSMGTSGATLTRVADGTVGTAFEMVKTANTSTAAHGAVRGASLTASTAYTASFSIRVPTGMTPPTLYYRPSGTTTTTTGQVTLLASGAITANSTYVRYTVNFTTSGTAPGSPASGLTFQHATTDATNSSVRISEIVIRQGTFTAGQMTAFSGNTPDTLTTMYAWTGTQYASASTETDIAAVSAQPYFDGGSAEVDLTLDRVYVYGWTSTSNASASVARLTVTPYAAGPLGVPGFARWTVLTAKSTGTSELYHHSSAPAASGTAGTTVTGSLWVRSSAAVDVVPVVLLFNGASVVDVFYDGITTDLSDGEWHRISVADTATGTFNRVRVIAQLAAAEILPVSSVLDVSSTLVDVGTTVTRPYFDGEVQQDGVEGEIAWSSTPHFSQSTLTTQGTKIFGEVSEAATSSNGTYQTVFQATSWAVFGSYSLGHSVVSSPSEDTYALPAGSTSGLTRLNMTAGSSYTISGFLYLPATQTGTLSANARKIALVVTAASLSGGTQTYYSDQADNIPGTYRLSLSVSLPADTTNVSLRLMHGATNGTVYWDCVLIEPGLVMSADYFDGDSPMGTWSGVAHDSTSSRPLIPEVVGATADVMIRSAWIE